MTERITKSPTAYTIHQDGFDEPWRAYMVGTPTYEIRVSKRLAASGEAAFEIVRVLRERGQYALSDHLSARGIRHECTKPKSRHEEPRVKGVRVLWEDKVR